ncbi:MAG: hypothetical protein FRX48_03445 [Lasallia pustulata]|uniref:Hydantoin racemase n=1 Tax=Lasallia pustulata TaxID=136370 RepID=A0A5M8PSP8_9LECA|nr:MAG: hypothetical protein FRX48_03445 [Lasallia pustulata]
MAPIRILIINPNSSSAMTEALKPVVEGLGFGDLKNHDAFLIACYSAHPLVPLLRAHQPPPTKPVLGIFEASVSASLLCLGANESFGIVSTGKVWEGLLTRAVGAFLGGKDGDGEGEEEEAKGKWRRFAGVETTGLSAGELHEAPREEVRRRVKEAAARLVAGPQAGGRDARAEKEGDGDAVGVKHGARGVEGKAEVGGERKVTAVCLGCAGMVGMEAWVREAVGEALGTGAEDVRVVDGVKVGVGMLVAL